MTESEFIQILHNEYDTLCKKSRNLLTIKGEGDEDYYLWLHENFVRQVGFLFEKLNNK